MAQYSSWRPCLPQNRQRNLCTGACSQLWQLKVLNSKTISLAISKNHLMAGGRGGWKIYPLIIFNSAATRLFINSYQKWGQIVGVNLEHFLSHNLFPQAYLHSSVQLICILFVCDCFKKAFWRGVAYPPLIDSVLKDRAWRCLWQAGSCHSRGFAQLLRLLICVSVIQEMLSVSPIQTAKLPQAPQQ